MPKIYGITSVDTIIVQVSEQSSLDMIADRLDVSTGPGALEECIFGYHYPRK